MRRHYDEIRRFKPEIVVCQDILQVDCRRRKKTTQTLRALGCALFRCEFQAGFCIAAKYTDMKRLLRHKAGTQRNHTPAFRIFVDATFLRKVAAQGRFQRKKRSVHHQKAGPLFKERHQNRCCSIRIGHLPESVC